MLVRFSGKHLKTATGPVDYAWSQVDRHLQWFCKKGLIRRGTARERKRYTRTQLLDDYVLNWRGQVYFRNRGIAGAKHTQWEDGMIERLVYLRDWVADFVGAYAHRNPDDPDEVDRLLALAINFVKLSEHLGAVRNDPAVGTGRPLVKGRPKGSKKTGEIYADRKKRLRRYFQPLVDDAREGGMPDHIRACQRAAKHYNERRNDSHIADIVNLVNIGRRNPRLPLSAYTVRNWVDGPRQKRKITPRTKS